ncbi:hypothetical protein E3Q14_01875 [Wallemia mellicola]|nr:hypothetical protein E3Q14_01875 [Wallemia mellicola]
MSTVWKLSLDDYIKKYPSVDSTLIGLIYNEYNSDLDEILENLSIKDTNDEWIVVDSLISNLYKQLNVEYSEMNSYLVAILESHSSLTLSEAIYNYLETFDHTLDDNSLELLLALTGSQQLDKCRLILKACNNRVQDAEDVLSTLSNVESSEVSVQQPTYQQQQQQRKQRQKVNTNWVKVNKKLNNSNNNKKPIYPHLPQVGLRTSHLNTTTYQSTSTEIETEDFCRQKEQEYRDKKQLALNEASRIFKASKSWKVNAGGQASLMKSQEAATFGELADEWAIKAAKAYTNSRSSNSQNDKIDLHYLTAKEALAVAHDCVHRWWSKRPILNKEVTKLNQLTFITGVGLHSTGKQPVLFPQIARMLENDGWKIDRQPSSGCIVVKGRA